MTQTQTGVEPVAWVSFGRSQPSLRRALLVWLLLPLVLLIPLVATLIYRLALSPALDGLDRALTDTAVALAQIIEVRNDQVTLPLSDQTALALRADLVDEISFAVGDPTGRLLGGNGALLAIAPRMDPGQWRFFEFTLEGRAVRVAAHAASCGVAAAVCPILVAETLGKRNAAERAVLLGALGGAAVLALPMVLLTLLAVSRGMRPLRVAAADVASRNLDQLDAVSVRSVPREVLTFVLALNQLFDRLRIAAAAQRAFVSDAAHQLRTPLAVLKLEAAQALNTPHPEALHPALKRMHAAAERGARLAHQLLALARVEAGGLDPARQRQALDLGRVVTDVADRWLGLSLAANQDLGFELAPAWVDGDLLLLEELLGNLVHNVIDHAGPGSKVTIRTWTQGSSAFLQVQDDGRGLSVGEHAAVWHRFHRGRGAAGTGSGLGLAIVKDIALLHGATPTLTAGDEGRGLLVCVEFPASKRAA
jgi:two-component system sensor histidine kinase TctE